MRSTTQCTCTSRTPLGAVTATRLDASVYSTSAASVYSCSTSQIHVRLAHSQLSRNNRACEHGCLLRHLVPWSTTRGTCRSMRPLPAAATTHGDASSMSAASVYSCSTSQIHVRLAQSAFSQQPSMSTGTAPIYCSCLRKRGPSLLHVVFTSDCDAQLLYTAAAPVLYASRRVAVTARSGVLDVTMCTCMASSSASCVNAPA